MTTGEYVMADLLYSFDDAIRSSVDMEAACAHLDLGPVDALDPKTLQEEYDRFFGTSPTSPLSSPSQSRPQSPPPMPEPSSQPSQMLNRALEREYDMLFAEPPTKPSIGVDPADPARLTHLNSKARRDRKKGHSNRRRKRREDRARMDVNHVPHPNAEKHIARAESTQTDYDTDAIPSALSGFIALPDAGKRSPKVHEPQELLGGHGFRIERAIVDRDGRIIAVLAGRPEDPNSDSVHESGYAALQESRTRCRFPKKTTQRRRGNFPALSVGISFGGGPKVPGNLKQSKRNTRELNKLLRHSSFKRIAGFASSTFHAWAPKLHRYYNDHLNDLLSATPNLRRNFGNSVWAAATFNFGPTTCILIPSAAITHSNTAISHGETRCSFTQYTAGGLFRWRSHGYQLDSDYFKGASQADMDGTAAENEARCKPCFLLLEEIRKSRLAAQPTQNVSQ